MSWDDKVRCEKGSKEMGWIDKDYKYIQEKEI